MTQIRSHSKLLGLDHRAGNGAGSPYTYMLLLDDLWESSWPQSSLTPYLIFVGTKDPFRYVATCSSFQKPRILLKENVHALEEGREKERLGEKKWLFPDMEGNLG